MRHTLVPVAVLVASVLAFLALNQIDHTRADCEGNTCDVVLDGVQARERVLDQEIALWSADGNVGMVLHRGIVHGCTEGETVESGSLDLHCTAVGSDILRVEVSRNTSARTN